MSFQAYLDNIEDKTGKTSNEFIALANEKGFIFRASTSGLRSAAYPSGAYSPASSKVGACLL